MNCHKVQNLISAYIDSELPGLEMLAVRNHISDCRDCRFDYESMLALKRSFGSLSPKRPSDFLAVRICQQLNYVPPTPSEQFLAGLRRHLTIFPVRLRFAGVCMGIFAGLLILRSGGIVTDYYQETSSIPSIQQLGTLIGHDPVHTFSAANVVEAASNPLPPRGHWGFSEQSDESSLSFASYTFAGN